MYNLKIKAETESFVTEEYGTFGWPIKYFDKAQNLNEEYNYTSFNLRIDDNTKPLLFVENTDLFIQNNTSRFVDEQKLLNGTSTDWSNAITLKFPNTVKGTIKENIAYYIKLQYFRQEFNPTTPNTVLRNENYFDSAFCPIDLPNIANNDYKLEQVYNPNLNYVRGRLSSISDEFGSVTSSGAYWDNDRILFYSKAVFQNKKTEQFYSKNKGIENKFSLGSKYFKLSFLTNDLNINCKVFQEETEVNQFNTVKSISISNYNGFPSSKENLFLLGIKVDELQSLITDADAVDPNTQLPKLSNKHHRYLFLEEDLPTPKTDRNGILFRKFKLKVQGITPNCKSSIITPDDDIFLYSRDGLCFTSKDFAESETVNDVNSFIEFIPLDTNNLYNSVRRLSMITIDTIDWQLYDLDGFPKKYDREEVNYAGDSIDNQEIKLPVGTRTIILGRSKKTINNFYCNYIVCFHEGQYREGFVNIDAFKNSNIGENNTIVRVNELEGKNHSYVLWKSFLDDSCHILKYLEAYVQVESLNLIEQQVNFYQPFINLLTNTREVFNIVSRLTPSILNEELKNLFNILSSLDLKTSNLGNIKANPNNIPDSIERWLSLEPFDSLINSLPSSNAILVLRFTSKWINTWNDKYKDEKFYDFYNETINKLDLDTLVNYFEQGSSGLTISESSDESISITKSALKKIKYHLINRDISDLINQTPEAIWFRSINDSIIDATTVFVLLNTKAWDLKNQNNFFAELAALDNSIGYIDNDYLCSLLIHEFNDSSGIKIDSDKSILLENTHIDIDETLSFFELLKTKLQQGSALDFFKDNSNQIQFYQRNKQYHILFLQTPFISIIYLNYYLKKISQK